MAQKCDFVGCANNRIGRSIYCRQRLAERKTEQERSARKALKGTVTPDVTRALPPRSAYGVGPVVADPEPSRRCASCGLRRPLRLFDGTNEHPDYKIFNYVCRVCDGTFDPSTEPISMESLVAQINEIVSQNLTLERQVSDLTRERDQLVRDVRGQQATIQSQTTALNARPVAVVQPAPDGVTPEQHSHRSQGSYEELKRDYDVAQLVNERLEREVERLERDLAEVTANRPGIAPEAEPVGPLVIPVGAHVNVLRDRLPGGKVIEWIVMVDHKEMFRGQSATRQKASDDGWEWVRVHRAENLRVSHEKHPLDLDAALPPGDESPINEIDEVTA